MTANQLINPSERLPHEAINFSDAQDFTDLYKGPSPFMAITLEKMIVGEDEWVRLEKKIEKKRTSNMLLSADSQIDAVGPYGG